MFRTIMSILIVLSFLLPVATAADQSEKEPTGTVLVTISATADGKLCAVAVKVDHVKAKSQTKKEHVKKSFARHHHKSHVTHHHKSIPHHQHHAPKKISSSHGPLHLTSPPIRC